MDWSQLLTPRRFMGEPGAAQTDDLNLIAEAGRSQFHKDYDRLIFSQPLRRLARKTQVHPLSLNDNVHTRLTHSLEVASVGRSLGQRLGDYLSEQGHLPAFVEPEDIGIIVQAACLAHDIGNPPFGHSGEDCIRDWFNERLHSPIVDVIDSDSEVSDLLWFDGNAQGFRIVTQLEKHWYRGGLRLTVPTLGTLLKYPWLSTVAEKPGKFSCFAAESTTLNHIATSLGMPMVNGRYARHPLAHLVEAADDICYLILDLEDAVELGIIGWDDFRTLFEPVVDPSDLKKVTQGIQPMKTRLALLRGYAMDRIMAGFVDAFCRNHDAILAGQLQEPLMNLVSDSGVRHFMKSVRSFAQDIVFRNKDKKGVEIGAYATLDTLLTAFVQAGYALYSNGFDGMSKRDSSLIEMMGNCQPHEQLSAYHIYLRVLDFISGMTDQYAARLANQIRGIF
ncbi:MAG: deoxyguanosinetriphosphate triphosphohydrolase [Pseudomonadota bacterium]|nr:deoxyguanosinetriphosphate triphosphohydrolase [Pseudomonadota bacterium]